MAGVFITATGTDVGKTYVAAGLIRALRSAGRAVDAFKPVLSGFSAYEGSDAAVLIEALGGGESDLGRMSPYRFAAPLAPPSAARAEGITLDPGKIVALCADKIAAAGDSLLIIEGAGGVMSPLAEATTSLDLMAELRLPAVLVAGSYLGSVSHTLTAVEVIEARGLAVAAIVICESAGDHPPLSEMTGALRLFAPAIPVIIAHRGAAWPADALAALL